MRSCRSRCARVFTYICVSTNGGLASFYGETMEEMWWGGGGERPVWRRSKCGEKQVVVGICRLPKSEKAGARYSRCIKYTRRMLYRMRLEYLALPPPGPPQLLEAHPSHMRLNYRKLYKTHIRICASSIGPPTTAGPTQLIRGALYPYAPQVVEVCEAHL